MLIRWVRLTRTRCVSDTPALTGKPLRTRVLRWCKLQTCNAEITFKLLSSSSLVNTRGNITVSKISSTITSVQFFLTRTVTTGSSAAAAAAGNSVATDGATGESTATGATATALQGMHTWCLRWYMSCSPGYTVSS